MFDFEFQINFNNNFLNLSIYFNNILQFLIFTVNNYFKYFFTHFSIKMLSVYIFYIFPLLQIVIHFIYFIENQFGIQNHSLFSFYKLIKFIMVTFY